MLTPVSDASAMARALEQAVTRLPELREMAAKGGEMLTRDYGAEGYWRKLSAEIADIRRARGA